MGNGKRLAVKDVLKDVRDGLTDDELRAKYELGETQLQRLFQKLIAGEFLTQAELAARTSTLEITGDATEARPKTEGESAPPSPPPEPPPPTEPPSGTELPPPSAVPPEVPPRSGPPPGGGGPEAPDPDTLRRYGRNAIIGIVVGLVLPVIAGVISGLGTSKALPVFAIILALVGTGVLAWGCYSFAKKKGQHPALALLALLCCFGPLIILLLPDRYKGTGLSGGIIALILVGLGFVIFCVMGIVLAIAIPYYVSFKRTACDRAASADLAKLGAALERLETEGVDMNCTYRPTGEALEYLVGPYYGWAGTTRKCEVRIRFEGDEILACATKGSHPTGLNSRYIYRIKVTGRNDLTPLRGPCLGKEYGGAGQTCYTETMLTPDCRIRRPGGVDCEKLEVK